MNDKTLSYVNQTARALAQGYHGANEPTLIAHLIAAKQVKRPDKDFPNGTINTAHAEVAVIQRAYEHGLTKGSNMVLTVEGREVCPYCRRDIPAIATEAGLNALTVNELSSGRTLYWQPGMTKLRELK